MKTLLAITLCLAIMVTGCKENYKDKHITNAKLLVLKKEFTPYPYGPNACRMYIFDGTETTWFTVDQSIYDTVEVNDTINTMLLTKVIDPTQTNK